MTSVQSRVIEAAPSAVWDVLADGWLYGLWVVGASRIRQVEAAWPEVGSSIHHSVGTWPLLLDDTTSVTESVPHHKIALRARAWPAGEATVTITLEAQHGHSLVTIEEDAVKGPGLLIPAALRTPSLDYRNKETLLRLSYVVENR